ncbi:MAG: VCBS repeat-containing protein, partial [Candidatus Eisenbacteria bacterium]
MYGTHRGCSASLPLLLGAGVLALFVLTTAASAVVPLLTPPIWKSEDVDYSTGGALIDLDGDGFLDLVTANGNDMARQPIRVYFNRGGVLELESSWRTDDIGYNCHIDLGDYDSDGDLDLAVAVLGDPGTPQRDKIYENLGFGLSSSPVWISGDLDNSFDLAWGDMDGDGDLDLAVACGESYTGVPQKSKVYRNDGGVITESAAWRTGPVDYTLDVAWGDVDNDGDLDLACGNEFGPNRIYLSNGSGLDSMPGWESSDTWNTLQIDFGDLDGDGWLDLA